MLFSFLLSILHITFNHHQIKRAYYITIAPADRQESISSKLVIPDEFRWRIFFCRPNAIFPVLWFNRKNLHCSQNYHRRSITFFARNTLLRSTVSLSHNTAVVSNHIRTCWHTHLVRHAPRCTRRSKTPLTEGQQFFYIFFVITVPKRTPHFIMTKLYKLKFFINWIFIQCLYMYTKNSSLTKLIIFYFNYLVMTSVKSISHDTISDFKFSKNVIPYLLF